MATQAHSAFRPRLTNRAKTAALCGLLLCAATASHAAADKAKTLSADEETYRQERASCLSGSNPQDRATCLREAGAARTEARRGTLDNGERASQLRLNALKRCNTVAAADRRDCERLALGEGQRSGSVAEGAIVKTIVTRTVGPVPTPAPAASAATAASAKP